MNDPKVDLTEPGHILRPYPAAEDVFVPEQVGLVRHLHPLVSVDLSAANPAWSGWVHILSPIEPYEDLPFQYGETFHNAFMKTNGLILRLEEGRYRFMGDLRSFLLEQDRDSLTDMARMAYDKLVTHYEEADTSYRRAAAAYQRYGRLYYLDEAGAKREHHAGPVPLLEQLGGTAGYANWTVTTEFPFDPPFTFGDPEPDAVWPLSPAGRRFEFVASTPGWNYRDDGADSILLFYEPVEGLVLLTFDWT